MARELEHVVGVAGLRSRRAEVLREFFFWNERFAVAVAAHHERAVVDDAVPEEARDVLEACVAGQLVLARRADDFRELCVGVQTVQRIFVSAQGIENRLVIEAMSNAEVLGVAGAVLEQAPEPVPLRLVLPPVARWKLPHELRLHRREWDPRIEVGRSLDRALIPSPTWHSWNLPRPL